MPMSDSVRPADPTLARPRLLARLPGPLRPMADGVAEVEVRGATVGEALEDLVRRHGGLQRHLFTEAGGLREHVNVFLGEDDIRFLGGVAARVVEGAELFIVPSIAGG